MVVADVVVVVDVAVTAVVVVVVVVVVEVHAQKLCTQGDQYNSSIIHGLRKNTYILIYYLRLGLFDDIVVNKFCFI